MKQYLLMAHNEDDLPMSVEVVCAECRCVCWLGPRSDEFRKANIVVIFCERCAHASIRQHGLAAFRGVEHLGNPLS